MRTLHTWILPRTTIDLGARTAIMGILNVTPDSFSGDGLLFDRQKAIDRGKALEQQGADILDVGGESTRPGSATISAEEETARVVPVIEALAASVQIPISIDTYKSVVARRALAAGAQIVNDISGFRFDPLLARLVNSAGAGVVLMHSRGAREDIHKQPQTDDAAETVLTGLGEAVDLAQAAGISSSAIVIDPGIGFSKDAEASFKVLKSLPLFSKLNHPLMVGTSRKSFIRAVIQGCAEARLMGTAATVAAALIGGAHIVRVHDVADMRKVSDIIDRILSA